MPEANQPAISVVIPCRNEAENLAFLIGEVDAALADSDYEVLIVDDGSTDGTAEVIAARIAKGDGRINTFILLPGPWYSFWIIRAVIR